MLKNIILYLYMYLVCVQMKPPFINHINHKRRYNCKPLESFVLWPIDFDFDFEQKKGEE